MAATDEAIRLVQKLHAEGLDVPEIAARSGGTLRKSTVQAMLSGYNIVSEQTARMFISRIRRGEDEGAYAAKAFLADGKAQWLDPVNPRERGKLRQYLETLNAFKRGQVGAFALRRFEGMEVVVRTPAGPRRVRLLTDPQRIREKARSGEIDEMRFWRGRGSP
jgi:hypothetical protein